MAITTKSSTRVKPVLRPRTANGLIAIRHISLYATFRPPKSPSGIRTTPLPALLDSARNCESRAAGRPLDRIDTCRTGPGDIRIIGRVSTEFSAEGRAAQVTPVLVRWEAAVSQRVGMATLKDILAGKDSKVISVDPRATVMEAAVLMNQYRIGFLVVADGERPVGVFSERDILRRVVVARLDPGKRSSTKS